MGELTYSAGNGECWHDKNGRLSFPRGQNLYGRDWRLVATDLAEDFHSSHDGWESDWPLELRIYDDGAEVARFTVELERIPTFLAWELDAPALQDEEAQP